MTVCFFPVAAKNGKGYTLRLSDEKDKQENDVNFIPRSKVKKWLGSKEIRGLSVQHGYDSIHEDASADLAAMACQVGPEKLYKSITGKPLEFTSKDMLWVWSGAIDSDDKSFAPLDMLLVKLFYVMELAKGNSDKSIVFVIAGAHGELQRHIDKAWDCIPEQSQTELEQTRIEGVHEYLQESYVRLENTNPSLDKIISEAIEIFEDKINGSVRLENLHVEVVNEDSEVPEVPPQKNQLTKNTALFVFIGVFSLILISHEWEFYSLKMNELANAREQRQPELQTEAEPATHSDTEKKPEKAKSSALTEIPETEHFMDVLPEFERDALQVKRAGVMCRDALFFDDNNQDDNDMVVREVCRVLDGNISDLAVSARCVTRVHSVGKYEMRANFECAELNVFTDIAGEGEILRLHATPYSKLITTSEPVEAKKSIIEQGIKRLFKSEIMLDNDVSAALSLNDILREAASEHRIMKLKQYIQRVNALKEHAFTAHIIDGVEEP